MLVVGAVGTVVPGGVDVELDVQGFNLMNVVVATFVPPHDDGSSGVKLGKGCNECVNGHSALLNRNKEQVDY